ncbi:hypothetical protein LJC56_02890 [Christensenellaceae bacterium OttesenSCG-928-K19]|nr:hypothetical protein [Christensenellaceae bacterium OttesenSCG-928-K19]
MEAISRVTMEMPTARSEAASKALEDELEKSAEFKKVLEKFDSMQETAEQKRARQKQEAEAAQEKKAKNKKIAELRGLIAQLKAKLSSSGHDPKIAAQLSAAQTQLFWLMFGM